LTESLLRLGENHCVNKSELAGRNLLEKAIPPQHKIDRELCFCMLPVIIWAEGCD
jgi:hypothetical protein